MITRVICRLIPLAAIGISITFKMALAKPEKDFCVLEFACSESVVSAQSENILFGLIVATKHWKQIKFQVTKYVCFNANPLHYYVLQVPRYSDRWR